MNFSVILFKLLAYVPEIISIVEDALDNGEVTSDEAAALGHELADRLGDIKWRVNGKDVIGPVATREIFGGLARLVREVILAAR